MSTNTVRMSRHAQQIITVAQSPTMGPRYQNPLESSGSSSKGVVLGGATGYRT